MVATRRGATTAPPSDVDAAASSTAASTSTSKRKTKAATGDAPRASAPGTPPIKIEFAEDAVPTTPRTARRRATAAPPAAKDQDAPAAAAPVASGSKPRQSRPVKAGDDLSIAQIRQLMKGKDGGTPSSAASPQQERAPPATATTKGKKRAPARPVAVLIKAERPRVEGNNGDGLTASSISLLRNLTLGTLVLLWLLHNKQTHLIGYCDSSTLSVSQSATTSASALNSNSNALLRSLAQHDAALASNASTSDGQDLPWQLALVPPALRPTCSPCPAHATCQRGQLLGCASREYATTKPALLSTLPLLRNVLPHDGRLPPFLGGSAPSTSSSTSSTRTSSGTKSRLRWITRPLRLLFSLGRGPRCVPDTHKLYLALQVGDEIRHVTRARRGQMECGSLPYPSGAALLDVQAWDARLKAARSGPSASSASSSSVSSRKWGRSSKSETRLPFRNVPHWPEPFLDEANEDNAVSALFTTDPQAYESEDYLRYNGTSGYVRWDLLQQHYSDIRFGEAEDVIKADLLERIDVGELSCSGPRIGRLDDDEEEEEEVSDALGGGDAEEQGLHKKARARACFDELWELAISDLQRAGGVLRFPVTGYPPSSSTTSNQGDEHEDPYTQAVLLSTTSTRPLSCSVRLAAISAIIELLPWLVLTSTILALLGTSRKRARERREESRIAAQVREEVLAALRERARRMDEQRAIAGPSNAEDGGAEGEGAGDASALLGDLSIGTDESGEAYIPIAHLRDRLLPTAGGSVRVVVYGRGAAAAAAAAAAAEADERARLPPKQAKRIWTSVRKQVGSNSNVRTGSRMWKGESMLVWEWVGL
ncbi:hypothetical protein V8E36_000195 [Tilletia maclaganii]